MSSQTGQIASIAKTEVEVSEVSSAPISQCSSLRSINCGNVTIFKFQIGGLALNHQKGSEVGPECPLSLEKQCSNLAQLRKEVGL